MPSKKAVAVRLALIFAVIVAGSGAEPERFVLRGHVPAIVPKPVANGLLPATNTLHLAIGLPLRNEKDLDVFLQQLYDPGSTNYHRYLSPAEFNARFGPTEQDYQSVIQFAESNNLKVFTRHSNRLVLDVAGNVSNIEQAFQITLRVYPHPTESRDFFAPDTEPSVPAYLPVADMQGLSDYSRPHPKFRTKNLPNITPRSGSAPDGSGDYFGNDMRNAYAPGATQTGSGQTVGLLEFDGFYANDITTYASKAGNGRSSISIQTVLLDGYNGTPTRGSDSGSPEVCLDIEIAMDMAPRVSAIVSFEAGPDGQPNDVLNSMLTHSNTIRQLSCSWGWSGGPSTTTDNIFESMQAVGQTFINAAGDSDAFTAGPGSANGVDNPSLDNAPSSSPYITQAGGTTLTMNGTGASYASETVWNWGLDGSSYVGTCGGISSYYSIPSWQTNISMASNNGSTANRNIPDVALTADDMYVISGSRATGSDGWGGTSFAAPLWAGFMALVNQQAAAVGNPPAGFINPAIYHIATASNYGLCFHDVTTGNNTWPSSPNLFYAASGYDLCTGLGTPNGTNLINALASYPSIATQPASKIATNGNNVSFSVTVNGLPPFGYSWLFNGTNLLNGGNVSGVSSNVLTLSAVTTSNNGNYSVVVANAFGSVTSSIAILTVLFPPQFTAQPTNLAILAGGTAVFSAGVSGSSPLTYQWRENGTNLVNGGNVSGATTGMLTLASVNTNNNGNYSLSVSNSYGSVTSSAATLTVVFQPNFAGSLTNRTIQCGANTNLFFISPSGTPPLNIQWKLDGTSITDATNASLALTNLTMPNHTITVTVTNLYGAVSSNATLTVQDTIPPVITLNGANPFYLSLGNTFSDPGATAYSLCVGTVPVTESGSVNPNVLGTNTIVYSANDGEGNTNKASRMVIVFDTNAPTIVWSFTNLILAAGANCTAPMPNVTGTNFITVTDLAQPLTITESPTNGTVLQLGTNAVFLTVVDTADNVSYSTNNIIVQDETPPVISVPPQSQTNNAGATVVFNVAATACTPVSFQWYFDNAVMSAQTNTALSLSNLNSTAAGSYFAVATANGGSTTSSIAKLTVNLPTPALSLSSSENPSGFRDSLIFTASIVPASATGTVQFLTNGSAFDSETLVSGVSTSTNISILQAGTNTVTAVYSGDANNSPATISLLQIVTNHPPVAGPAYYCRLAGYPLDISVASLATNWSDPDGGTVSLAAIGVSTNGVSLTNNAGTLVYINANDVDDQFTCTITDNFGGIGFQYVNIMIILTNKTPHIIGQNGGDSGGLTLFLTGAPNHTYILQATTNFLSPDAWVPIYTNMPDTNGVWQFTDPDMPNFPYRFYRLMLVQ